jgi:hypothetical protein
MPAKRHAGQPRNKVPLFRINGAGGHSPPKYRFNPTEKHDDTYQTRRMREKFQLQNVP